MRKRKASINITDGRTGKVLGRITAKDAVWNEHDKWITDNLETFDFITHGDRIFSEHLGKANNVVIPNEDGGYIEFRIVDAIKVRDERGLRIEVFTYATHMDLNTAKVITAGKTPALTTEQHIDLALSGTGWERGTVHSSGVRSIEFEEHTNPRNYLRRITREFDLEMDFRIETDASGITGRYVDLVPRIGQWRGRTVEFKKDLIKIQRREYTKDVITALRGIGPRREDGTRLEVFVEDLEAKALFGIHGENKVDVYEPETEDVDMTEERLIQLTRAQLNKIKNAIMSYETLIADLENVPGLENKKIRFGDTIRIKELYFNPPLYLEARVYRMRRDIFDDSKKYVELGDYVEFTEDEAKAARRKLEGDIRRRIRDAQWRSRLFANAASIEKYKNILISEKQKFDNRYSNIANNTDLPKIPRENLDAAKKDYDDTYAGLMTSINAAIANNEATDAEKQDVDKKYGYYQTDTGYLSRVIEQAHNEIMNKKRDDLKTYTDQRLNDAHLEIDAATELITFVENELRLAENRIDFAEQEIADAQIAIDDAQTLIDSVTGDKDGMTVLKGTLVTNYIVAENATLTGTLIGDTATILNLTTDNMTAIQATLQDSTITGQLIANDAVIVKGTFNEATILDATIQDATVTGSFLSGATGSIVEIDRGRIDVYRFHDYNEPGARIEAGALTFGTYFNQGFTPIATYSGNKIEATGQLEIVTPKLKITSGNVIEFQGGASIDTAGGIARLRRDNQNYSAISNNQHSFYMQHGLAFSMQRRDVGNNGLLISGGSAFKFLASGSNIQARNASDTEYIEMRASIFNPVSSERYKSDIKPFEGNASEIINNTPMFDYVKEGSSVREIGMIIERGAPDVLVTRDREAVMHYSMTSLVWLGHQEHSKEIERVWERIRRLEGTE